MTEADWLECTDPKPMLEFLRGKVSDRKLRLFACACCRRVWHHLFDERSRKGIEVAEWYADGAATDEELDAADDEVAASVNNDGPAAAHAVYHACFAPHHDSHHVYRHSLGAATKASAALASNTGTQDNGLNSVRSNQMDLLHDIFGNPFRPSPPLPPAVFAWNEGIVRRIAQGIYQERRMPEGTLDNGRLFILHDALLDAGCSDEELLTHLRSESPHVRGCWAIDQLLGKK